MPGGGTIASGPSSVQWHPPAGAEQPIPDTGACTVSPASPLLTVSMIRVKCVLVLAYATIFLTATALSNTWSVATHYIM